MAETQYDDRIESVAVPPPELAGHRYPVATALEVVGERRCGRTGNHRDEPACFFACVSVSQRAKELLAEIPTLRRDLH